METLNLGKKNVVPNSIEQTLTMLKYSFLDYIRSRRFFVLLIIAVAVASILTGVIGYFRPSDSLSSPLAFYSSWWGESGTFIIILSAIFFGGDAISGEFQNKTGYFLVGNPIRRSAIYIGKWLAALIASLAVLAVFALMTIGNGFYYFGSAGVPNQFLESLGFSVLYMISVLGLTFFFSSMFKSSTVAILTTVILLLFVFSLVQTLVADLAHVEPWFMITYGAQIIGNVLMNPYPPPTSTVSSFSGGPPGGFRGGSSVAAYNATIPEGIIILVVYFFVTMIVGLVLFERKEFT